MSAPEEIRDEAIILAAKAIWGMSHGPEWPWDRLIYDDPYRVECMNAAAVIVDALGDLLPTGIETEVFKMLDGPKDFTRAQRYVTDWREVMK